MYLRDYIVVWHRLMGSPDLPRFAFFPNMLAAHKSVSVFFHTVSVGHDMNDGRRPKTVPCHTVVDDVAGKTHKSPQEAPNLGGCDCLLDHQQLCLHRVRQLLRFAANEPLFHRSPEDGACHCRATIDRCRGTDSLSGWRSE